MGLTKIHWRQGGTEMAISVLHLKERKTQAEPLPGRVLYHLSLDRAFSHICHDVKKQQRFMSVISNLMDDTSEILFRQAILKDFESNPTLLNELTALSARFEELRVSQKNIRRDELGSNSTGTASSTASKNILSTKALCLKRALLFVKAYGDLLAQFDLNSNGLRSLLSACKELSENAEFSKLITFCSKYEYFSEYGYLDYKYVLNDEGCIETYELIDHRYIHVTDPAIKKKSVSLFKKVNVVTYPCVQLAPGKDIFFENLAITAFSEQSKMFENLSEQIFERFGAIGGELVFYEVAIQYIQTLSEKGVSVCYPTVSKDKSINIKKLYDLYLLFSKPNASEVIPNDILINGAGLLVFGNNGSGKTVYLRSLGSAQILAQAGLPLPCDYAKISLFSQLATQFSEAEKEFCTGNDAGRFEQEVRELAEMVNTLKEGAFVLLNETFQSTAYAEGAEGLYHLLVHFSALNIRWILVSHLNQLEEKMRNFDIDVLYLIGHKHNKYMG